MEHPKNKTSIMCIQEYNPEPGHERVSMEALGQTAPNHTPETLTLGVFKKFCEFYPICRIRLLSLRVSIPPFFLDTVKTVL